MRRNIDIDDRLLAEAMRRSGARTKKAAVEAGLRLLAGDLCSRLNPPAARQGGVGRRSRSISREHSPNIL